MKITVLGGCGAWPSAGQACSGYLVEREGFRLLIDPGYATLPRLLATVAAERIDAVLVSHGHPDHCADLNPLLRARALGDQPPPALPVHAPPGALDAVLALDNARMLAGSYALHDLDPARPVEVGPFRVQTWALPHFVPNAGMRLTAGDRVLAYTGDTGPSEDIVTMARDADVLLAEATFPEHIVPAADAPYLSTARQAGEYGRDAGVGRLLLTHLWPDTDPAAAEAAAGVAYTGDLGTAVLDLVLDLG
ncbi:MBL fold metallo-hydrolase [Solihabitans fulvus]|uniref:MBL fold metallo-hydrolase n=1 Tax=Solihabitans fulvus TaxID=1892852 RepID=A0A5B2WWT5_9PSEU|nr:MBL fold metallo-hydrolase [Solihabitans fulvus]KAA2255965.1 MBL fold metallo-hydrolase [Solihabitans fulvus]